MLFGPLVWLGSTWGEIVAALTNLEQVIRLYETKAEVTDTANAIELVAGARQIQEGRFGQITFDNVSFHYSGQTDSTALENCATGGGVYNVSFRVEPGKTVALCGATGSGKVRSSFITM